MTNVGAGDRGAARLETNRGPVEADKVVLAMHVPITSRGVFFARVHQRRAYLIAADARGEGEIVRLESGKAAVFRDDEGRVHAVSAKCTHMGCDVAWNDAERTWDCPCHGSRFDTEGCVLEGPATTPLAPVPAPELSHVGS